MTAEMISRHRGAPFGVHRLWEDGELVRSGNRASRFPTPTWLTLELAPLTKAAAEAEQLASPTWMDPGHLPPGRLINYWEDLSILGLS